MSEPAGRTNWPVFWSLIAVGVVGAAQIGKVPPALPILFIVKKSIRPKIRPPNVKRKSMNMIIFLLIRMLLPAEVISMR